MFTTLLNNDKNTLTLPIDGSLSWEEMQDQIFYAIIQDCLGCRTWTAQRLDVALRTVRNRIKRLEAKGFKIPERDVKAIEEIKALNRKRSISECRARMEKEGILC